MQNKEEKLYKLKNNLEDLLSNLENKKNELSTYLKESELQINTIKNQLHILNNHLYEKEETKEKEDASEAGEEEDYASEAGEEESEDDNDIEERIMANIDPNLARLLGMEVQEETKSDWVPPSFSGLHNSQRNSMYDHIYKK
jgi:hypothetical protein